jgi:hypothetical protein
MTESETPFDRILLLALRFALTMAALTVLLPEAKPFNVTWAAFLLALMASQR